MRYREWKLINESLAGIGSMALGLSNPNSLGGPVGSTLREMGDDLQDEEDFEDEELEDEELENDEEDEETDLFGDDEFGGDMDFPPDDSEEMDGLPTPDEEMLDADEMGDEDDFLGDIDPELAGLDDDEMGLGDEMLGDEMLGDEDFDDEEVEAELGMDDMDVEVGDEELLDDEEGDFMDRMADYCGRYMADYMRDHMRSKSRKFMKSESTHSKKKKKGRKYMCGKGCDDGIHSREDMTDMASNHFGKKNESNIVRRESVGTYDETEENFFATLRTAAKGDHNDQGWSGLSEDMLLQLNNPNTNFASNEPQAGEAGFAPQGRVGSMGGGYTQDDIQDIPTMPW